MLNFHPVCILSQRKFNFSLWKFSQFWTIALWNQSAISSRVTHCYWAWTDGSIHFLITLCPIHLLWGFNIQFVMHIFDREFQGLFSWLNSKDAAGNLYVMMWFWSPISGKAAKILGFMRGLFLFQNLSAKPACLCLFRI